MAVKITSTKETSSDSVNVLVFSRSGVGKTVLCSTAPKPIILSAESGLLSLRDFDIPVITINTVDDVNEAYDYIVSEGDKYKTICLDSISEIAEVMLIEYKSLYSDARKAYGELADDMATMIRKFRDLDSHNVYFSAKQIRITDDHEGTTTYVPMMPGKTLLGGIPYFFDEVLCMRIGEDEDGNNYRYLQTSPDISYDCKDRSGTLDDIERPDLTHIFKKILKGGTVKEETPKTEKPQFTAKTEVE